MAYSLEINLNTGDDASTTAYGVNWRAQTFTTVGSFDVSRVGLKLFRSGSPGNVTVSIWDTASGKPSGGALVSQTQSGNTITTNAAGEWVYFVFSTPLTLSATHVYAIVWDARDGNVNNYIAARRDGTSPPYGGGLICNSANSGSSWTTSSASDYMFETYSGTGTEVVDMAGTAAMTMGATGTLEVLEFIDLAGTAAMAMNATGVLAANILNVTHNVCLVAAGNDEIWYEDI